MVRGKWRTAAVGLETALRMARMVVWTREPGSGRLRWQGDERNLFGCRVSRVADLQSCVHPDDMACVGSLFDALPSHPGSATESVEFRVLLPDGGVRWLAGDAQHITSVRRPIPRALGIAQDIDSPKRAKMAAARALADHQLIFDASPAFIWYKDCDNRILRINLPAATALGCAPAAVEGKFTDEFYPAEAAAYYADDLEVMSSGLPKIGIVETLRLPSGEQRWIRTDKIPSRDEAGRIVGVVVFALDITEQKRAEIELEAALRAKGELLAVLSHELRTPIAVILGFAELLVDGHCAAPDATAFAAKIVRQGRHLTALIDEILDLAKAEYTSLPVTVAPFRLTPLLVDVTSMLSPAAGDKGVSLYLKIDADVPLRIVSDAKRLRQILINVIGNAVKFTLAGDIGVHVMVAGAGGNVSLLAIDIADTGIGMEEGVAARLFEPFFQADPSQHLGTGLGLALSKKLAPALGGDLVLTRSETGVGSCFRITVALTSADPPTQPGAQALAGMCLLVVDDSAEGQQQLLDHGRGSGATMILADSAGTAVAAAKAHNPTLALVTLRSVAAGQVAAAALRASAYQRPVIGLDNGGVDEATAACSHKMPTPKSPAELTACIRLALGQTEQT